MAPIRTVGLLGLGKMGAPMAKHIAAKGYAVVGYDPAAAASAQAAAHGARIARSPREVAEASDVVIIVVGFDSEVEQALFGRDGIVAGARRCTTAARRTGRWTRTPKGAACPGRRRT